jgi:hypothetical protein
MSIKNASPVDFGGFAGTNLGGTFGPNNALSGAIGDARYDRSINIAQFGTDTAAVNAAIAAVNAGGTGSRTLGVKGPGPYNVTTNQDLGLAILEMDGSASFTGAGYILPSGQTFTNSERYGKKFTNTSVTAYDIYGNIFPNVSYYDVVQAVAYLHPGSDLVSHLAAIAGYIRVDAPINGIGNNAVALFGGGVVTVNNGTGWGLNTLLQDSNARAIGTGTGRVILGAELDFNVMNPGTQVIGVSVGGNSLVQPTNAIAYIVNSLGLSGNLKWTTGFASFDGCADNGLSIGTSVDTGANVPSQNILISWRDASAVKRTATIQAAAGFLQLLGAHLSLDTNSSLFLQAGRSVTINGNQIISDRRTGWTAGTGTAGRGAFNADTSLTIGAAYTQAEVVALRNQVIATRQRVLALEADLRTHGLIN